MPRILGISRQPAEIPFVIRRGSEHLRSGAYRPQFEIGVAQWLTKAGEQIPVILTLSPIQDAQGIGFDYCDDPARHYCRKSN